ncbi:TetR/AcrR family transcriptional regulator [Thioclava sp. GXIMD4215]|uniref:TetR/AcrR family transcriptional regulator n=1 Tax=Thioclava sp. GXIMD4215 TaxID=3131928 RepID=UPI0032458DFB
MTEKDSPCAGYAKRHAAGQDPEKREQILDGAWEMFLERGFDATTMNSICKAAGVSKSTLYVYFADKQDLFVALVEQRKRIFLAGVEDCLAGPGGTRDKLLGAARLLAGRLCAEDVVRVQRIVIGVVERMPELGQRFYEAGARNFLGVFSQWLGAQAQAGQLSLSDPVMAAHRFSELVTAGIWRQCLFGLRTAPPSDAEIERNCQEAVRIFLLAYGPPAV